MTHLTSPSAAARPRLPQPSLGPITELVAPAMAAVDRLIGERLASTVPLIPELAGHLVSGGGKRLRPMLTLAAAQALGYRGTLHHPLAAAVEFIHTATLLHDDVVDGSELRRGRRTANRIWGNQPSVLVGDYLFARAFELMVESRSIEALAILSRASSIIAEGEVAQLVAQRRIETSEDAYLQIIRAKTAELFAAAARVPAVIAGAGDEAAEGLSAYGMSLGIAFQLVDDALDYRSDAQTMGKSPGDDLREGKLTLPVILAFRRADAEGRAFWRKALAGPVDEALLAEAIARLEAADAIDATLERARAEGEAAIEALAVLPPGPAVDALAETADFAVRRAF